MTKISDILRQVESYQRRPQFSSNCYSEDAFIQTLSPIPTNYCAAFMYVHALSREPQLELSEDLLKTLHVLVYQEIQGLNTSSYRKHLLKNHALPEDIPRFMGHLSDQYLTSKNILHPIELATMVHQRIIEISPFDFGNEVIALLSLNLILLSNQYEPIVLHKHICNDYVRFMSLPKTPKNLDNFTIFIANLMLEPPTDAHN